MRISDSMTFPHPVLAPWRDDFNNGTFEVEIPYREDKKTNRLEIIVKSQLSCASIEELIGNLQATFGCFVLCVATGYRRLINLAQPEGRHVFGAGDLLGTVILRPIIYTNVAIDNWTPTGTHSEFNGKQSLKRGDIVAIGEEQVIEVAQADLPALETIFQIKVDDSAQPGEFDVDLDREKITILAARETYELVETLRASGSTGHATVMNSVYVPIVMRILNQICTESGEANLAEFDGRRWVAPFERRCEKLGINHFNSEILKNALVLLERPFHTLEEIAGG